MPLPTNATRRAGIARTALTAVAWGLAGAVCAGGVWAIVLLLAKHFFQLDATDALLRDPGARPFVVGVAAGWAFLVAVLGCIPIGGRSWLRVESAADVTAWCVGLPPAAAVGAALSVVAVVQTQGWLSPQVASSLGFSVTGFLAAFGAYVWTRWSTGAAEPEGAGEDEESGQAPGAGIAGVPVEPEPSVYAVAYRLLPVWIVSSAALIIAVVIPPSHAAFALLAVAALGFASSGTHWSQELRIRELERRLRNPRQS